jgi:hypothetical protein
LLLIREPLNELATSLPTHGASTSPSNAAGYRRSIRV